MRPRILSVRQPWASLLVHGIKDIENRTWVTNYRGPVFIHASNRHDGTLTDIEQWIGFKLTELDLPAGGIVGIVTLADCVRKHPSRWFQGPRGFLMTDARALPFLKLKGALSLREAPEEAMTFYARQLKEISNG